ncbi:MAG: MFS transporter [Caulobacteraceae bacterium]
MARFAAGVAGDPAPRPLRAGFLGLYGVGSMVEVLINFALNNFLLFYLTIVCGLSGAAAGLAALASLGVDAMIDPLVGSLSDNLHSPLGRRHPFLIGASLPAALALVLLFSIPQSLHGIGLFAYAVALSLALRISLSLFQVPYFALGAELTQNYVERSTIVAFRVAMGVAGTLAATVLSYRLFLAGPGGTTHRAAYQPLAWCFAAIIAASGLIAGFGTLGARPRLHPPPRGGGSSLAAFAAEIREIFRNPSFRILFTGCLVFFVAQGVAVPLTLHANTYFWRLSTEVIGDLTLVYTAGLTAGIFAMAWLSARLEKRTLAIGGLSLIVASQFTPVPLRIAGLLPTAGAVFAVLCVACVFLGVGVTAAVIGFQSMMADAADEHEHLFGSRREGLYFAGINLSAKASSGLGTLIAGVALDVIGFPHNLAARGASIHIAAGAVRELGLIYGPGAALLTFVAVLILTGYGLGKRRHGEILAALAQRRTE